MKYTKEDVTPGMFVKTSKFGNNNKFYEVALLTNTGSVIICLGTNNKGWKSSNNSHFKYPEHLLKNVENTYWSISIDSILEIQTIESYEIY